MMNKLLTASLLLLGVATVASNALSCAHSKPYSLSYVKPLLTRSDLWHEEGIVKWPSLPVRVATGGMMTVTLAHHAKRSIDRWNSAIGCTVFEASRDPLSELMITMQPRVEGTNWAASARYVKRRNDKKMYWGGDIHIYILKMNNRAYMDNLMSHELGHMLGLRDQYHDDDSNLVMHANSRYGVDLDPAALEYLRWVYCE